MARLFDQSNDEYIDGGDIVKITGDEITVSTWLKLDSTNGEQKLVSKWADVGTVHQYLMSVTGAEKAQFVVKISGVAVALGATTISTGVWHNIIGRYDGSDVEIFLDGVQDGTISQTGNIIDTTASLVLGAGSGGSGSEQPLDGFLGHVAIWDIALSDSNIESLANCGSPLQFPEGLVFYAPLNGQDPELDIVGGNSLTVNGSVKAEEPPIPRSVKAP